MAKFSPMSGIQSLALAGALFSPIFAATVLPVAALAEEAGAKRNLEVIVDRARVVRIAKPADTVIVGNPSIVDATIQDARTLVLTGRLFGVTNIIVLDADGDPIVDETVVVKGEETNLVHVYRQADRETLACAPVCQTTLTLGDQADRFRTINEQITARNSLAEGVNDD
ncbi:MAG: pilus assembly protein N-terminal domain-containing protein [Pseudomonadota bacterium]